MAIFGGRVGGRRLAVACAAALLALGALAEQARGDVGVGGSWVRTFALGNFYEDFKENVYIEIDPYGDHRTNVSWWVFSGYVQPACGGEVGDFVGLQPGSGSRFEIYSSSISTSLDDTGGLLDAAGSAYSDSCGRRIGFVIDAELNAHGAYTTYMDGHCILPGGLSCTTRYRSPQAGERQDIHFTWCAYDRSFGRCGYEYATTRIVTPAPDEKIGAEWVVR